MDEKVVRGRVSKANVIRRVIRASHRQSKKRGFIFPITRLSENEFRRKLIRDRYYVVIRNHTIIGTVAIKKRKGYWEIGSLAVLPEYQGKGLGSKLLRHAQGKLRGLGVSHAVLHTPIRYTHLVHFYRKRGYHITTSFSKFNIRWARMKKKL